MNESVTLKEASHDWYHKTCYINTVVEQRKEGRRERERRQWTPSTHGSCHAAGFLHLFKQCIFSIHTYASVLEKFHVDWSNWGCPDPRPLTLRICQSDPILLFTVQEFVISVVRCLRGLFYTSEWSFMLLGYRKSLCTCSTKRCTMGQPDWQVKGQKETKIPLSKSSIRIKEISSHW